MKRVLQLNTGQDSTKKRKVSVNAAVQPPYPGDGHQEDAVNYNRQRR